MPSSALESLARCSEDTEIWFDSSPLIYRQWAEDFIARRDESEAAALGAALAALYDASDPAAGYLRGSTTNQPLALQALDSLWPEFEAWVHARARSSGASATEVAWDTFKEVARRGSEMLMPVFSASGKRYGHICAQVDPRVSHDTDAMVEQAVELHAQNPNVMIKMPGTAEGIAGVERLAALGVSTNLTLAYTLSQLLALAEAAEAGYRQALAAGRDLSGWRSCCTMMLGRFEDHPEFKRQAVEAGFELSETDLRWAGVAVLKKAYRLYQERGYHTKLLAASMRVGPKEDGRTRIWHLDKFAGGDMVLTIFPNIIEEFMAAYAGETIVPQIDDPVPGAVVDRLRRTAYLRQAYDEGGLAPDEFASYPPLVATAEGFVKAMNDFEQRVVTAVDAARA